MLLSETDREMFLGLDTVVNRMMNIYIHRNILSMNSSSMIKHVACVILLDTPPLRLFFRHKEQRKVLKCLMTQDIGQIRRMSKITTTVFFCCCHFLKTFGRVCLEIEGGRPTIILRDLPRKKIICLFCRMSNGYSLSPLLFSSRLSSSIFSRLFDRSVACSRVGLYLSRETKGETTNHRHECFSFFHLTLLIEKYSNMTNEICM